MSEFKFHCPQCARRLKIDAQLAGAQIRCPACQQIVRVPLPGEEHAAEALTTTSQCQSCVDVQIAAAKDGRTSVYWRRKQPPTSSSGSGGPADKGQG